MRTDTLFYKLFRERPEWLRDFAGLPLPPGCKGTSQVLKQFEIHCDMLFEPVDPFDPFHLVEFQLYHDHSVFNRTELARHLLWKQFNAKEDCRLRDFQPREIEIAILFGSRKELPASSVRYASIRILFIDELLEALEARHPDSPLAAALAPLKEPLVVLEKEAARHYDHIQKAEKLAQEDREVLNEIYLNLLLQRFKTKTREEIRRMIAELTPIHETRVGQELLAEGIEKGSAGRYCHPDSADGSEGQIAC